MNTLTVAVFACVVVLASAKPSGLLGLGYAHGHHGHYDHLPLVGASGVVSSHGAAGPAGVVNGHGAVGPNGIPNAVHGHGGVIVGAHGLAYGHGYDDGQYHGEGLVASQDWAGHHGAAVIAPHAAVIAPHAAAIIAPAVHSVAVGHGIGLGHGVAVGHGLGLGHGVAVGHGLGLGHGIAVGHGHGHGTIVAGPSGTIVADGHHGHHGLVHHGY